MDRPTRELPASGAPLQIVQGQTVAMFAFDFGYEVNLDRLDHLLPVQPVQPISRTKQTPTYLQYATPPRTISLGETTFSEALGRGHMQATIFDFGAVSISFRWPLAMALTDLPAHSKRLFDSGLEQEAWRQARSLMERIEAAIVRPSLSALIEDYYVFIAEEIAAPDLSSQTLLGEHGETLTQILRFETAPLDPEQQQDALSRPVSYYWNDLAVIDWNAAFLWDSDYADTLNVLELMNVELLEARFMDAELDRRIDAYQDLTIQQPRWFVPLLNPYRQTIRELAELRIEAALLAERIENALKLIGDLYLARIHNAAGERFYIGTWDEAISRKLEIVGNLYELLTDRVSNTQAQTLELIIILLIVIEIFFK